MGNFARGMKAKRAGDSFENYFVSKCKINDVVVIPIPDGCQRYRSVSGKLKLKPVQTPFDYFITKDGWSACMDCKTFDAKTLPFSAIKPHQRDWLAYAGQSIPSGYIVWFRPIDSVVFFNFHRLNSIFKGQSLKPEHGIDLGKLETLNPGDILGAWKQTGTYRQSQLAT